MSGDEQRVFWDEQAATFDDEPDHGLNDPETRTAWAELLEALLPKATGPVVDLGCGTGSLSMLLTARGHRVLGIDVSPKMIRQAQAKALREGFDIEFRVGDVATAEVPTTPTVAVVSRHLLWAFDEPENIVERWSAPLTVDGAFVAVEGVWGNAGIAPDRSISILERYFEQVEYTDLASRSVLWGKDVSDCRYAVVGHGPRSAAS